ncbi:MAG: hypothetical protein H6722_24775 [Sandaracinus sp.]|nr:hypothetical protein [Sandaracinus sp.]MCB9615658.1 hypothetical protein [Sandaracinus sp.]MCB9618747.1 hypothetical protein [Sandaracinus sp.]
MTTIHSTERSPSTPRLTLDELARRDVPSLDALYHRGKVPALATLDGNPTGRMLAVRGLDREPLAKRVRSLAGASFFPWGGKSFASKDDAHGLGVNRVHLGGSHKLFPFHTTIEASVVDGAPCIRLDYDLAENPWVIRHIHDEVREVSPGLFLGPAMWVGETAHTFVLWFALDTNLPAAPFGWG